MNFFNFLFRKPVVKQDRLSGHYFAYYKDNLEVISQGATEQEALTNLKEDLRMVKEFKKTVDTKEQKENHNHRVAQA